MRSGSRYSLARLNKGFLGFGVLEFEIKPGHPSIVDSSGGGLCPGCHSTCRPVTDVWPQRLKFYLTACSSVASVVADEAVVGMRRMYPGQALPAGNAGPRADRKSVV